MTRTNSSEPSPPTTDVRRRMLATKRRDTPEELRIRSALHRSGLRYSIDARVLCSSRARADILFRRVRVVVFVDGCFWHGCPKHGTKPKKNAKWWAAKLEANIRRDRETDCQLRAAGWRVIRVWAHEAPEQAARRIGRAVATRRGAAGFRGPRAPRRGRSR